MTYVGLTSQKANANANKELPLHPIKLTAQKARDTVLTRARGEAPPHGAAQGTRNLWRTV